MFHIIEENTHSIMLNCTTFLLIKIINLVNNDVTMSLDEFLMNFMLWLSNDAWGAIEAIGTVSATVVALGFGYARAYTL